MKLTITPKRLSGTVNAVSSKSDAHRKIIAAALSDKPTEIAANAVSEDIKATLCAVRSLGGDFRMKKEGVTVMPIDSAKGVKRAVLDFNESGSTARFLIPVAAAIYDECEFFGHGRLPRRPFAELINELRKNGVEATSEFLPIKTKGRLASGLFTLPGNVSSQYISGLLFALPLLDGESKIRLTTALDSAAYVDMTLDTLSEFGVDIVLGNGEYTVRKSPYISPGKTTAEGDWSNAAFWIAADKICGSVEVTGLSDRTYQGDRKIMDILDSTDIDASQIPDLVPILAVLAAARRGRTVIRNAQRLRIKESDRLKSMTDCINALGGTANETPDGIIIDGSGSLCGGVVDGCGDHRVVMSAAIASCICTGSVTINGAEAVNKSYPSFFEDFKRLGGEFDV